MDYLDCLLILLSISVFTFFGLTLLVVVSVRYIKLIRVGFRAHVKKAFRVVS